MACFVCNQYGHWSRDCPESKCSYCGVMGHSINACSLNEQFKKKVTISNEPISSTRTRKSSKTLEDILYENHIVIGQKMKEDVDSFIKTNYSHRGIIDDTLVAESIFGDESQIVFNSADNGHLSVLGYIIGKYCDVSNDTIKSFLRNLEKEINNYDLFRYILNSKFSTGPLIKNGNIHFRKLTGYSV